MVCASTSASDLKSAVGIFQPQPLRSIYGSARSGGDSGIARAEAWANAKVTMQHLTAGLFCHAADQDERERQS
jgi:hypothetical protein